LPIFSCCVKAASLRSSHILQQKGLLADMCTL
jgi:hypothetical protein